MDFQTPKFWEFTLLSNQKNEGNPNFRLSQLPKTACFLQKLALKVDSKLYLENTWME